MRRKYTLPEDVWKIKGIKHQQGGVRMEYQGCRKIWKTKKDTEENGGWGFERGWCHQREAKKTQQDRFGLKTVVEALKFPKKPEDINE